MTFIDGGLRARLIRDSLEALVRSGLEARGWFDAGRRHAPIVLIPEPNDWDEPIEPNSLAITGGDSADDPFELGSTATEDRWTFYIDFYAEDESVGTDVSGDVRDLLRGQLPSIGRTNSTLPVLDFRQATPSQVFSCDIDDVVLDRGRGFNQPWLRWWFTVRVDIVDEYYFPGL